MTAEEFRRFVEEAFGPPTAVVQPGGQQTQGHAQAQAAGSTPAAATDQSTGDSDQAKVKSATMPAAESATKAAPIKVDRGETVRSRARPDYDALGVRAGSFILYPEFGVSESYDDNIFRDRRGREGDFISVLQPKLRAASNWNRHALEAEVAAALGFHAENSDEDYQDLRAALDGRIDVSAVAQLHAGAGVERRHADRDSPDDADGVHPTEYYSYSAEADYSREFGRIRLTVGGQLERLDYLDNERLAGGLLLELNNDDRDRLESFGRARVAYAFKSDSSVYLESRFGRVEYDSGADDSGFDRDSMDYRAVVGLVSEIDGIVSGDLFAGYIVRDFDDSTLSTVERFTVGGKLTWNVTPLTTVTADSGRTISATTINNASSATTTQAGITVDHELLRNVLIQLRTQWRENDYDGIDRTDDTLQVGLGADVLVNRNLTVSAHYSYGERLSDERDAEYRQNLFSVGVKAKF